MKHFSLAVALCALLPGCTLATAINAKNEMLQSQAALKSCLAQNAANPSACSAAAAAFEADMQLYRVTSARAQRALSNAAAAMHGMSGPTALPAGAYYLPHTGPAMTTCQQLGTQTACYTQ